MATNVNMEDERFAEVEAAKDAALSEVDATFNGMAEKAGQIYQQMANEAQRYAETQSQLQQERTDFTIEQIEQQKEQAEKDYTKEQSGAYVDWQKQSGQYGVNAEQMAAAGMSGTGYSESSQVSMYNTYQNRVATAREAYSRAVLNYDNAIKDAQLQNNAALAEIAYNALQTQLSLSLESLQYGNELLMAESDKKLAVDDMYYGRYQDVLAQINQENAFAEEQRQFNANLAEERRQYNENLAEEQRQFDKRLEEEGEAGGIVLDDETGGIDVTGDNGGLAILKDTPIDERGLLNLLESMHYKFASASYEKTMEKAAAKAAELVLKGELKVDIINGKAVFSKA